MLRSRNAITSRHVLLFLLYTRTQAFIFKGGTALRIVYRGNRYSEDLDFNGPEEIDPIKETWSEVTRGLDDFGMRAENRNDWTSEHGYSFDVSYQGPLYDGREAQQGQNPGRHQPARRNVATRRELVSPEYDDLRTFMLTVLTPSSSLQKRCGFFWSAENRAMLMTCGC